MWLPNLPVALISAVAAGAGGLCIFRDMYSGPPYDASVRCDNKTVLITGANTGIGREAAAEFAKRGARVFMACRNMEKCEAARRDIVLETKNKYVYCRPCDLASTASITEFVRIFKSEEPHLHVLVNNAGVMEPPEKVTREGFETQLGVNHLGHFLLTNLLLDTIKASAPSRIIVVTSGAHRKGVIHREDLNLTNTKDKAAAYAQSKLANLLFAKELGRQLLDKKVSVIAVDPGLTATDLTRNMGMMKSITRFFIYPLFWPFMKLPRIGAQSIVHAALDPKLNMCSGDLYIDMKKAEPSKVADDFETALWLWKVSASWTKLDEHRQQLSKATAA